MALVDSSLDSLTLLLPVLPSRGRLFLDVVGLDERGLSEGAADWSAESLSLSLAWSRSFSFWRAAFTLALERVDRCSETIVEAEAGWSRRNSGWSGCEMVVLELAASN